MFSEALRQQAAAILAAARGRKLMLATAESCTGGLIAALFTEIAGSSDVLERGFVTYSNEAKEDMLGVPTDLIHRHGAVSEAVARAMAEGALKHSLAQIAVAVTGIAGPGGGTPEKPVGLVYIALAGMDRETTIKECRFGDIGRSEVRLASVHEALASVRRASDNALRPQAHGWPREKPSWPRFENASAMCSTTLPNALSAAAESRRLANAKAMWNVTSQPSPFGVKRQ